MHPPSTCVDGRSFLGDKMVAVVGQILTTLKRNLSIPVTCKIRLLKSQEATVDLARMIESTGVSALAVHGR